MGAHPVHPVDLAAPRHRGAAVRRGRLGRGSYVRRYRIAWIEVARKNGKSELLVFIALYLLVADGVEGAEIYGCAMDRGQAAKVFDVAARMVKLSPVLSARLVVKDHIKRIIDEQTGSYYEVVAADAAGNLGHNPHGVMFDEVLTQRDSSLWDAMRTGMGTRAQPLVVAATTAGDDPASFARACTTSACGSSTTPTAPGIGSPTSATSSRTPAPGREAVAARHPGAAPAPSHPPRTGCAPNWPAAGPTPDSTYAGSWLNTGLPGELFASNLRIVSTD